MSVLDPRRWQRGWGSDGFCAWGASDDSPHPARIVDHDVSARNRLIAQYRDKPNMLGFVAAFASTFQSIEDAGQGAAQLRGLEGALSALDGLGSLFSLDRAGQDDNSYRARLAGAAASCASGCTPEELRSALELLMGGLQGAKLREDPPGCVVLQTFELSPQDGADFAAVVGRGAPAGCRTIVEFERPTRDGPAFAWEDDNGGASWAESGGDPATAGLWAEACDGGPR